MPSLAQNPMAAVLAARAAQQQRQSPQPAASVVAIKQPQPSPVDAAGSSIAPTSPASPTTAASPVVAGWFTSLSRAATSHRNSMVEIAYYGHRIAAADAWQELGFRDEDHCRQHLGFPESTWTGYMRLGDRLSMLTLEQMTQLTQTAARQLTRIHPKIWEEYSWVEEAKLLPARDFQTLVDSRNKEVSPMALSEPKSNVTIQVPMSQRKVIEARIEKLRRGNRLTTTAATLSHIVAAAESQADVTSQLINLESQVAELARLWQPDAPWSTSLSESSSEQELRLAGDHVPESLAEAAILSQRLVRRLLKSMEALHAVLPKEA